MIEVITKKKNTNTIVITILTFAIKITGVRGVVWFGFGAKGYPKSKIKKHAVWFGMFDF